MRKLGEVSKEGIFELRLKKWTESDVAEGGKEAHGRTGRFTNLWEGGMVASVRN